jgi:general secretion pathway protein E
MVLPRAVAEIGAVARTIAAGALLLDGEDAMQRDNLRVPAAENDRNPSRDAMKTDAMPPDPPASAAAAAPEPFAPREICKLLFQAGLLTKEQVKRIIENREIIRTRLERERKKRQSEAPLSQRVENPITIVDVIASMNLERADIPNRPLDEEQIYLTLAQHWQLPYKKIDPLKLNLNLVTTTIPRNFAMKHLMLPIAIEDGYLTVATPDPFNREAMEDIARASSYRIRPVVSAKGDVIKLINEFFGFKRSIAAAEVMFSGPTVDLGNLEQYVRLYSSDELPSTDQHIVNAVNHLFTYAFEQRASDIHIEPKRDTSLVRLRIDGVLHTVYKLPKQVHNAIVSRIKNMSRLNMAEKRRPQDGRIKTDKGGVEVEIRISTVPVAFGEKIVMRIMDPDILFQDLEGLGFTGADLVRFNSFITKPHGIVIVCGPTGSGKSTTLYSTLRQIASPEINIITVEDPIEMIHEDFNQIGVQPAVDVTFESILRNILRQDPDVIMIGEMRDIETARNAVQAALTGHLVLSTLHTNDAPAVITRALDIGVPAYLIQSTLVGVLAQRLVRKICRHCIEPFMMQAPELRAMGLEPGREGTIQLHRGKGCVRCRNTGYQGRTGVFEVLPYSESLKRLTTPRTNLDALRQRAREEGMNTLRESAVAKMLAGITTCEEVLRVTWEQ